MQVRQMWAFFFSFLFLPSNLFLEIFTGGGELQTTVKTKDILINVCESVIVFFLNYVMGHIVHLWILTSEWRIILSVFKWKWSCALVDRSSAVVSVLSSMFLCSEGFPPPASVEALPCQDKKSLSSDDRYKNII